MSEIKNCASNHDHAASLLQDLELDAVSGGVTGDDGGCIPPWTDPRTGKIVFVPPVGQPNPWLPGGSRHG